MMYLKTHIEVDTTLENERWQNLRNCQIYWHEMKN